MATKSKELPEEGSAAEEAAETPGEESQEQAEGTESSPADEGAKIPEAFQKSIDALVEGCANTHQLDYISNCVNEKRTEMYKSESPDSSETMSAEDMPQD